MINVILYQPEIPSNTGNILRTCAATGAHLHIIGPMGFSLNDDSLKRAGMDYIDLDNVTIYESYEHFIKIHGNKKIHYITRYGHKPCDSFDFSDISEDYFVMFGKESSGIPRDLLADNLDTCIRLNLSNCVAIVVYEILRQQEYYGLSSDEAIKGDTYLEDNF